MRITYSRTAPARVACGFAIAILLAAANARAAQITDELSLDIVGTGVYQAAAFEPVEDRDRITGVVDVTGTFKPTNVDTFSATASYAVDEALNDVAPVSLAPFADDLEDALEDVSNRNRDYLLTAWYQRKLNLGGQAQLALTGGLIDTTAYLDQNAYANDEVGQFMNDIFVNNTLLNLPSYDLGAAAEYTYADTWSASAVWFNGQTERASGDEGFNYYGAQIGWHPQFDMGAGNYRAIIYTTDDNFAAVQGGGEALTGFGLSIDQELSKTLGIFARAGWQDDEAAVSHDAQLSGGLNIAGTLWGRPNDTLGIALAYLSGANGSGIDRTVAAEAYVKVVLTEWVDVSLDAQYIGDDLIGAGDVEAAILGLRLNLVY